MAATLEHDGFNFKLAPVVDLSVNANNFIAKKGRTFSAHPHKAAKHAAAFIDAHWQRNILTSLKYFPSHGRSRADSHKGLADVTNTWSRIELEP